MGSESAMSNEEFPLAEYVLTLVIPHEATVTAQSLPEALDKAGAVLRTVRADHPAAYISRLMERRLHSPLSIPACHQVPPPVPRPPSGPTPGTPTVRHPTPAELVSAA